MRTTRPERTCVVTRDAPESAHARVDLDAPVHGAGMHHELAGSNPLGRDPVERRVLPERRDEGRARLHALRLHAERVHDVDVRDRLDAMADPAPELLDAAWEKRRRPHDDRLGTDEEQGLDERARHARVQHVADDRDRDALETTERLLDREEVEQRLRRMLMLAVAGVDHVRPGRARDDLRGADVRMADDDHVGLVLRQRERRVSQRLSLVDRRSACAERHRVGGKALGGELEARERARRRLVEEVQDEPATERRQLLDLPVERPGERAGSVEDALDILSSRSPTQRRWRMPSVLVAHGVPPARLEHRPRSTPVDLRRARP